MWAAHQDYHILSEGGNGQQHSHDEGQQWTETFTHLLIVERISGRSTQNLAK
jgi:hypothetical protein